MFDVQLRGLGGMVRCMMQVALGRVRVMRGSFVVPRIVVPGRFAMMARRVLVVFSRLMVVFRSFFRHSFSPVCAQRLAGQPRLCRRL
jgi:hypothetical protein